MPSTAPVGSQQLPGGASYGGSGSHSSTYGGGGHGHGGGPPVERGLKPRSGSAGGGHFGTVPRLDHSDLAPLHSSGGFQSGMGHPLHGGEGMFRYKFEEHQLNL